MDTNRLKRFATEARNILMQDELTPDVPLNEITILQQGEISIE